MVSKSITITVGSIESISLWLSFSLTLSIVPRVPKTIAMTIAKRGVSESNMMTITITMSKRIDTVAKTISSIGMVKRLGISFRFSLTLGSRGNSMDTYSVGNIGNPVGIHGVAH